MFAVVTLAAVIPPAIAFALACAIDVRGVTWMPVVMDPDVHRWQAREHHVAGSMGIVEPVASSK